MTHSWYENTVSPRLPSRRTVLWVCVLACVANILLVGVLAGTGVLKSTERGDIRYTDTEPRPAGDIVVPADAEYRYAIESPTDADAFYNMVVRVWSGGPLYNTWAGADIQEFHYLPITYYFFAALSLFGYVAFKYLRSASRFWRRRAGPTCYSTPRRSSLGSTSPAGRCSASLWRRSGSLRWCRTSKSDR